jgi:hypothetical protein
MLETAALIGIDEGVFWRMTVKSFRRHVEAHRIRQEERMEIENMRTEIQRRLTAELMVTVMNYSGRTLPEGKFITVDELLNPPKKKTEAEIRAELIERFDLTNRYGIA